MAKSIPLTKGLFALVDDEDFEYLNQFKWQFTNRYAYGWINNKSVLMHRVIMKTPHGMETDHINGNGLDNRKENLRVCTVSDNQKNKKPSGKSKYLGVSWNKWHGKWVAQINIGGKVTFLGYFDDEEKAAKEYDKYAIENHGAFARPNFK